MNELRTYIRKIIESVIKKKELIGEPDLSEDNEENEVSLATSVAGVTTPLGTTATYPRKLNKKKKKKSPTEAAASAFANAKTVKQ